MQKASPSSFNSVISSSSQCAYKVPSVHMCWTTADSCLSCFKSVNLISLNRQQRALISVYCALVCSVDTADSSQDRFLFCIFSSELQDLEWKLCIVWTESITNDLTVHFQYWNMLPTPPSSSSSSYCCFSLTFIILVMRYKMLHMRSLVFVATETLIKTLVSCVPV